MWDNVGKLLSFVDGSEGRTVATKLVEEGSWWRWKLFFHFFPFCSFIKWPGYTYFLPVLCVLQLYSFFYQKQENKNCISFLVSAYILSSLLLVDFKILYVRSGGPQRKDDRDGEARQVVFEWPNIFVQLKKLASLFLHVLKLQYSLKSLILSGV